MTRVGCVVESEQRSTATFGTFGDQPDATGACDVADTNGNRTTDVTGTSGGSDCDDADTGDFDARINDCVDPSMQRPVHLAIADLLLWAVSCAHPSTYK